jgi:lipid-A-disaccharide synthase
MKYFFIAGEASGDKHGSAIIAHIKEKDSSASFSYLGGDMMHSIVNFEPIIHIRDMAFMGFVEVAKNLLKINKNFTITKRAVHNNNPDVIVLIDYPGYNLRMAKWCKEHGYKVVYYISPSVWAWHKSRIETIRKYVDLMICILPFEEEFYKRHHVHAVYLGNPIYDKILDFKPDLSFIEKYNLHKPILALLPGSRVQEIDKILPTMIEAAKDFSSKYDIVLAKADNLPINLYQQIIGENETIKIIEGEYYNILHNAALAIVTSGTATLETALFQVPQVVVYKTNAITYAIAKRIVDIKYISLPNLITDKPLVKELIQKECTPDNIRNELYKLIEMRNHTNIYKVLFEKIGSENSAERIAKKIIEIAIN